MHWKPLKFIKILLKCSRENMWGSLIFLEFFTTWLESSPSQLTEIATHICTCGIIHNTQILHKPSWKRLWVIKLHVLWSTYQQPRRRILGEQFKLNIVLRSLGFKTPAGTYVGKVYRFIVTQQMKSAIDSCYTHMPFMVSCMGIAGVNNAVDPMTWWLDIALSELSLNHTFRA